MPLMLLPLVDGQKLRMAGSGNVPYKPRHPSAGRKRHMHDADRPDSDAASATRPRDVVVIAGAPLSGTASVDGDLRPASAGRLLQPAASGRSARPAGRAVHRSRAEAILTKLVGDNIRNHESLAIVSELHGDPWATGCLDRLREAGYRIRLLLICCEEAVLATRARHRNLDADDLVERQRGIIDQAAMQAAKGARVELLGLPWNARPSAIPAAAAGLGRGVPAAQTGRERWRARLDSNQRPSV